MCSNPPMSIFCYYYILFSIFHTLYHVTVLFLDSVYTFLWVHEKLERISTWNINCLIFWAKYINGFYFSMFHNFYIGSFFSHVLYTKRVYYTQYCAANCQLIDTKRYCLVTFRWYVACTRTRPTGNLEGGGSPASDRERG